jgi:hypothetical protein
MNAEIDIVDGLKKILPSFIEIDLVQRGAVKRAYAKTAHRFHFVSLKKFIPEAPICLGDMLECKLRIQMAS